ncbi:hypothetical protein T492DRAFT_834272 [Pavlovales sp. CCMP2436]|nr:hypothetical protein T492DRAFT_834272 [Pavlovales sp. CCMP2436]
MEPTLEDEAGEGAEKASVQAHVEQPLGKEEVHETEAEGLGEEAGDEADADEAAGSDAAAGGEDASEEANSFEEAAGEEGEEGAGAEDAAGEEAAGEEGDPNFDSEPAGEEEDDGAEGGDGVGDEAEDGDEAAGEEVAGEVVAGEVAVDGAAVAEEEEEDEGPMRRRKRQRKVATEDLDEDDYDLIEENTGRRLQPKDAGTGGRKRLSKRVRESGEDGEDGEVGKPEGEEDAARRIEQELFDGDEGDDDAGEEVEQPTRDEEIGSDDGSEEDAFIVDEEGRAVRLDEPDTEQGAAEVEEAHDIFGTADEMAELLAFTKHQDIAGGAYEATADGDGDGGGAALDVGVEDEDEEAEEGEDLGGFDVGDENEDEEDKAERQRVSQAERVNRRRAARMAARQATANHAASKLRKLYPPAMLAANFMLPTDERTRALDVPERMQARAEGRPMPDDAELRTEAEWIVRECADGWFAGEPRAPPPEAAAMAALVGPVERALRCVRLEMLEVLVPTIAAYRKDEIHPLVEAWLWEVHELDGRCAS